MFPVAARRCPCSRPSATNSREPAGPRIPGNRRPQEGLSHRRFRVSPRRPGTDASGGQAVRLPVPEHKGPVLFSQADWTKNSKNKKEDIIDVLLQDPKHARLYWALSRMDDGTRRALRRSPGLEKLTPDAAILDSLGITFVFGPIGWRSQAEVAAEPAWKSLVGASPDSPADFVPGWWGGTRLAGSLFRRTVAHQPSSAVVLR